MRRLFGKKFERSQYPLAFANFVQNQQIDNRVKGLPGKKLRVCNNYIWG